MLLNSSLLMSISASPAPCAPVGFGGVSPTSVLGPWAPTSSPRWQVLERRLKFRLPGLDFGAGGASGSAERESGLTGSQEVRDAVVQSVGCSVMEAEAAADDAGEMRCAGNDSADVAGARAARLLRQLNLFLHAAAAACEDRAGSEVEEKRPRLPPGLCAASRTSSRWAPYEAGP